MSSAERYLFKTESKIGPVLGNLPSNDWQEQYQIKVITLRKKTNISDLYYLEKGWVLEFHLSPSLFGSKLKLYTNHPPPANIFDREKYYLVNKTNDYAELDSICGSLPLCVAGTFHYYFTDSSSDVQIGSGYFLVNPVLSFGPNEVLDLDSIKCQTVLTKCLGSFDNWEANLQVSKESGYNMIHFTPVQELGGSNSSYSVKDQLKLNPMFNSINLIPTFDDLIRLTEKMRRDWKVLSIGDVVLNHTANESPWLKDHPECTYNMITASYFIPAAILDGHLQVFSKQVSTGNLLNRGIPKEVNEMQHIEAIQNYLRTTLVPQLKLHEFATINVEKFCEEFSKRVKNRIPEPENLKLNRIDLKTINNFKDGRNQAKVDLELAIKIFNIQRKEILDENIRLAKCLEDFKSRLLELNSEQEHKFNEHLKTAINNCIAQMIYFRIDPAGPKLKKVSADCPLIPRYFTGKFETHDSVEEEVLKNGQSIMAHNGWVMNYDCLKNFAGPDSNVYLRRELIAWGDSVKLRYGESYNDCPFLWDYMQKYVELSAKIFDGFRLDNCHSTPIHVAEYLLDCARKIKPDLYVVAELFTGSEETDAVFSNRLGINSIVREATNAHDARELARRVYKNGGKAIGNFIQRQKSTLTQCTPHALFFDVTHDNPSPIKTKSVFDSIPTAALVSMSCCATGSSRGFDELVPHHIDVVKENRLYPTWGHENNSMVGMKTGMIAVKRVLNDIHEELGKGGFSEVYVDVVNNDVIEVTRHNPVSHESVVLVSYTAFSHTINNSNQNDIKNLKVEGELYEIILEAKLVNKEVNNSNENSFKRNENVINGLTNYEVVMKKNISINESDVLQEVTQSNHKFSEFQFKNFAPGTIVIVRVRPHRSSQSSLNQLKALTDKFLVNDFNSKIISIVSKLDLIDLNYALYRCSEEDSEDGTGAYNIPDYGSLVYCGLQGFESVLQDIRVKNDLGHPLCQNLREGDWMLDYIVGRLKTRKGTVDLGLLFQEIFEYLARIPRYLIPKYVDIVVSSICYLLKSRATYQMSEFVKNGSTFVRYLALGSIQCVGVVESASLPAFSTNLLQAESEKRKITMSAGLPYFSTGFMRSWGRDTFVSLRGLLLLVGRFEEARFHILGYAACLRHGLIPNLLDGGMNARYNCRDGVWWWLYSIMSYIELVPNGHEILRETVSRIFPQDDCPPMGPGLVNQFLHDIIQEALSIHFRGLTFRERNAGAAIDAHMLDNGFNNTIGTDLKTGFVFGGNESNCGTWMDKMGSDFKTGNKGKPATPRDGSAVELIGLCKAVVGKLHELNTKGIYPYEGVERTDTEGNIIKWSFRQWEDKISENFEKFFWIPENPWPWEKRPELIHRRLIYKDCFGASQPWTDYQLRPNFLIALTVAPEMVTPENAWKAIKKSEEVLLGPLGMKTLDPADWNYNGNYYNEDNSANPKTAHGFNYHQGPEWLWPVGFFLRAKLHFSKLLGVEELRKTVKETKHYLGNHYQQISSSHWQGLPELTNENGTFCANGCPVQAWSMACILEVLYELNSIEKEDRLL